MSRRFPSRFQSLLGRAARVRQQIDQELHRRNPSEIRLVRLQRLNLIVKGKLSAFVRAKAIARASAPRWPDSFRPHPSNRHLAC
jgi:hypothetical protein